MSPSGFVSPNRVCPDERVLAPPLIVGMIASGNGKMGILHDRPRYLAVADPESNLTLAPFIISDRIVSGTPSEIDWHHIECFLFMVENPDMLLEIKPETGDPDMPAPDSFRIT